MATLTEVNEVIKLLARKDRKRAVAVLAAFDVFTTPELKASRYELVIDIAEQALEEIEAASAGKADKPPKSPRAIKSLH
jgi:hypothetical protein